MTKKSILTKVLPAALIFVLVLLLVVTISSCTKNKKTPTGSINNEEYLSIPLSDGKTKVVTKKEFYNKLRYLGYTSFNNEISKIVFAEQYDAIVADLEAHKTDLENSKYYDKLVDIVNERSFGTSDEDEIEEFTDKEKASKYLAYMDTLILGNVALEGDDPYQYESLLFNAISLAKKEFARTILLDEAAEIDGDYEITLEDIEKYYDENFVNKGDSSMLFIRFRASSEVNETLKALKLKFVNSKLYRVENDDPDTYDEFYDSFSTSADGVSSLSDSEVLFEYMRIYNNIYSYRNQIVLETEDYTNVFASYDSLSASELATLRNEIYNTPLEDLKDALLEQNSNDFPKFTYTFDELNSLDDTFATKTYEDYSTTNPDLKLYSTDAISGISDFFLVFKLEDASSFTYDNLSTLANYVNAIDNNYSKNAIYNYYQQLCEVFADYIEEQTETERKAYFLQLAEDLSVDTIIANAMDKEDSESIWNKVFEDTLTTTYIDEKANEYFEENCKFVIYDELFEKQFANKNEWFEESNKQSSKYVVKITVKGKEAKYITVDDMFTILENSYGPATSFDIISKAVLKDKYYSQITEEELDEYEEQYANVITNFGTGSFESYGFPASIGQKAFIQLYMNAENKEEAIFNSWIYDRLVKLYIYENADDTFANLYASFEELSSLAYENYISLKTLTINIYTDDNEDDIDDDPTTYTPERKAEVETLAKELMNLLYSELQYFSKTQSSSRLLELETIYKNASRISEVYYNEGDVSTPFATESERNAYLFGKFKKAGIFLRISDEETIETNALKDMETSLADQYLNIYNWALENAEDDDANYFAKEITLDSDNGIVEASPEIATVDNLLTTESGYIAIFAYEYSEPLSAKFTVSDNPDDDVDGKVFPYSTDEENPFPLDTDKMDEDDDTPVPLDNTGAEDSLYNTGDKPTANQIIIYVREYQDGVTSLYDSVSTALDSYFKDNVYTYFTSSAFQYVMFEKIISTYDVTGAGYTKNSDAIHKIVEAQKDEVFAYDQSEAGTYTYNFIELWWELFA